jgi:hypothetical protein
MGTRYGLNEVLKVGPIVLIQNFPPAVALLIGSLIPLKMISELLMEFDWVVTLNKNNLEWINKLTEAKVKACTISPGIDEVWINLRKKNKVKGHDKLSCDEFIVTYLGGASELRGPGILINSIAAIIFAEVMRCFRNKYFSSLPH